MRVLALCSVVFLIGAGLGFYEARAAQSIQFDAYLANKNVSKKSPEFLNGYAAGTYDAFSYSAQVANNSLQSFYTAGLHKSVLVPAEN